ncbi:MAG TPA: ATP-binding protein [Spongiibacteraceae bacterium]
MRNRSLKTLIITTALAPSLLVALALGIYLGHSRLQDVDQLLRDRGHATALQLANAARQALLSDDQRTLQNLAALALEERSANAVALYDRDRHLRSQAGPQIHHIAPGDLSAQPQTIELEDTLRFITPITSLSEFTATLNQLDDVDIAPLGWVVIEYSREPNLIETYRSLFVSGLVIALAIFGAAAIAVFSSRRLDHAVAALQRGIQRIENGDFDTPIHLQEDNMLQELAQDLNRMAAKVQAAALDLRRNLEQTNRDLRESLETVEVQNIELDLARREALEGSRIKSEFLANTSHELRTPLNGIIGFTKLLLKTVLDIRQREYLETIRYSAENLLSIINDILDFSKIEAGKLILDNSPFNLREVIEDTLAILAPSATEKRLDLILLYDNDVPAELIGDPLRLRQVLTNLISNAIKFTQQGHIAVRVALTASIGARVPLKIGVSDTGIGIDAQQQQLLFNAFAQADTSTSREYGGTGLGLAISKRLIEQMGGEIGLDSQLGTGSTFWFSLRLPAQQNPLRLRQFDQLAGTQLLLYDPNPLSQTALSQLLESWFIKVIAFASWQDAINSRLSCDGWLLSPAQGETLSSLASITSLPIWLLQQRGAATNPPPRPGLTVLPKPIGHLQLYDALCSALLRQAPLPLQQLPRYPLQVLAVDDNATNLKLVAVLLEEFGASIALATSGKQALELCTRRRFDLILLDIQMPELNGAQVADMIRSGTTANRDTRIVALTAHLLQEEQRQLLGSGFDQCLTKPITEDHLQQLLETCSTTKTEFTIATPVHIELCLQRARNKADLAREFLQDLLRTLDKTRTAIATALQRRDYDALLHEIHKLHGACCYSGVPRLQQCSNRLEELLKRDRNAANIPVLAADLLDALNELQQWGEAHDLDILFDTASAENETGLRAQF